MEQWGLWHYISAAGLLLWAVAVTLWARLTSLLPGWGLAIVFTAVAALGLVVLASVYSVWLSRRAARLQDRHVKIDRDALADELAELCHKIGALSGGFSGPMQEAWWAEAVRKGAASNPHQVRAAVEGRLIEKFTERYIGKVWVLIRRSQKVVAIDRNDLFRLQVGIRSEQDLAALVVFLATLSDDVRNPAPLLPMSDRHRSEAKFSASDGSQAP